jgi:long-subunit fatty acid transport protein
MTRKIVDLGDERSRRDRCGRGRRQTPAGANARAAGFWIEEMGTPDPGTASAGRAALAKDAATAFGNPAGMTSLDRSQLLVGPQMALGDVHFDRGSNTTVDGGNAALMAEYHLAYLYLQRAAAF